MNKLSLWGKAAVVYVAVGFYGIISHLAFVYFVQGGIGPESWASLMTVVWATLVVLLLTAGLEYLWHRRYGSSLILRPGFVFGYCILVAASMMLLLLLTSGGISLSAPGEIAQWLNDYSVRGVATLIQLFVSVVSYGTLRNIALGRNWPGNQPGY